MDTIDDDGNNEDDDVFHVVITKILCVYCVNERLTMNKMNECRVSQRSTRNHNKIENLCKLLLNQYLGLTHITTVYIAVPPSKPATAAMMARMASSHHTTFCFFSSFMDE